MDAPAGDGPVDLGWPLADACTLPDADRPLRLAEFDELFRSSLRSIDRAGQTRARLLLAGPSGLAGRTQQLADAETACCSFFTFGVASMNDDVVALDVEVPAAYAQVLAALLARAETCLAEPS